MLGAEDVKKFQIDNPQVTTQVQETLPGNNTVIDNTILHSQIGQQLGLASLETEKYGHEIDRIVEWAKANGAKTLDDIIYEIKYLSNKLGHNPMEKRIKTISRYVFLSTEKQKLNREIERLVANE